jgi:hypothetical protein
MSYWKGIRLTRLPAIKFATPKQRNGNGTRRYTQTTFKLLQREFPHRIKLNQYNLGEPRQISSTSQTLTMRPAVRIVEVGPRDGLQNIKDAIPTSIKLELIRRLEQTGLRTVELTSVVSPRAVPQLADCREILRNPNVKALLQDSQSRHPVLVPNLKGLEIAIQHNVREIAVFISATEGFSRANINCTVAEGIERATRVVTAATKAGLTVRGCVNPLHSLFKCDSSLT